jgi:acetylornithine deacetylase/succinyl-diaminopimelate desuccinylase-like protein
MSRLALTDADKQARDWFVETTKELGCCVKIDAMGTTPLLPFMLFKNQSNLNTYASIGNIFAIRPGKDNTRSPTYAGSHMDTQVGNPIKFGANDIDLQVW